MEFNFNFINYFETPTILQKLNLLKEADWITHKARNDNVNSYVKTKTIVARGNKWVDCHVDYLKKYEAMFEKEMIDLHNFFLRLYKHGQLTNFVIVKLLPNSVITKHTNNNLDSNTKRFIIPVTMNPQIHFEIGEEKKSICANEIWEINNSSEYRVENYSCHDCIHTIVDWKLEG
jgi:hypothetical protein